MYLHGYVFISNNHNCQNTGEIEIDTKIELIFVFTILIILICYIKMMNRLSHLCLELVCPLQNLHNQNQSNKNKNNKNKNLFYHFT